MIDTEALSCQELVELVTEYLEGGLSPDDRERFEEHLGVCDLCVSYLGQMRETISSTGRLRAEELDPQLHDALVDTFRGWKAE